MSWIPPLHLCGSDLHHHQKKTFKYILAISSRLDCVRSIKRNLKVFIQGKDAIFCVSFFFFQKEKAEINSEKMVVVGHSGSG